MEKWHCRSLGFQCNNPWKNELRNELSLTVQIQERNLPLTVPDNLIQRQRLTLRLHAMSSDVKTKINHGVQNDKKKTITVSYWSITSDRPLDMADSGRKKYFFFVLL